MPDAIDISLPLRSTTKLSRDEPEKLSRDEPEKLSRDKREKLSRDEPEKQPVENVTNNSKKDNSINLDDILVKELGEFGRFQINNILLVAVVIISTGSFGDYVFTAADVPHRCRIPECGEVSKNETFTPEWLHVAVPKTSAGFSGCERYAPVPSSNHDNNRTGSCSAALFNNTRVVPCDGFVYGRYDTLVYDFDLGCQDGLRVMFGTILNVGTFVAFPIAGIISDRFGRRFLLIINCFSTAVLGITRIFAINYPMLLVLQFLLAVLGSSSFGAAYIFATELVGPKYRVITGCICSSLFALGEVLLGGIAWLVHPWHNLMLVLYIPGFLFVSYYWFLSESVRWLLAKHKYVEAKKVLDKVARVNGKQMCEKSLQALTNPPIENTQVIKTSSDSGLVRRIIRSPVLLRRVCTIPIWWVTSTFVYYGLSINSVGLSGTIYLNYMLTCLVEIPGFFTAAYLLYKIGRKNTLFCGFVLAALCNFAFAFLSKELYEVRLVLFLLGKFSISGVFTSVYLFTSELYPTEYRHSLLGFSSTVGRVGSLSAPLTPLLIKYWEGLPAVLFGTMGLIAGALVLTQPETLGTKLPDTLAEAEALGSPASKLTVDQTNKIS